MQKQLRTAAAVSLLVLAGYANAAAPTAAISASPISGAAPLGVLFDASGSSADAVAFLWEFGDGSASTAKSLTHVYLVAGTYAAKLTVTNAEGLTGSSQVAITVTGTGEGPVTADMSFRWALQTANFNLKHGQIVGDTLNLISAFNTVDLPGKLSGLAVEFSINRQFSITGVLGPEGIIESVTGRKPEFFLQVDVVRQQFSIFLSKADMKAAFAASGATDSSVPAPGKLVPVTFTLTIGAQSYDLTENFTYVSSAGATGNGKYLQKKGSGTIHDGFFVITQASALENLNGASHLYVFSGLLSRPLTQLVQAPPATGAFTITFNDADPVTLLADRFRSKGSKLVYAQPERDLGGVRTLAIDVQNRTFLLTTWDLPANVNKGGTGLPVRGDPFVAFDFTVRFDFDQADGTLFQTVTATRLTRRARSDALWQTGRKTHTP
ncbi:MAG TPA: PKD domain-containing protein [Planctomycetota bacterium]|jgi:PKD repeat protein